MQARLMALAGMCLVVALAVIQAQPTKAGDTPGPNCTQFGTVSVLSVCATLNTVNFQFTTTKPTSASISISTDRSFALTVLDSKLKKVHNVTIRSVAPATNYNYLVKATPKTGKPATWNGSFVPQPYGSVPMNIGASNMHKLTLNGVPFFVIEHLVGCPTPETFAFDLSAGINAVEGATLSCPDPVGTPSDNAVALHAILDGQTAWRDSTTAPGAQVPGGLPELLNWGAGIRTENHQVGVLYGCTKQYDSTVALYGAISKDAVSSPVVSVNEIPKGGCINGARVRNIFWTIVEAGGGGVEYQYVHMDDLDDDARIATKQSSDQMATLEPAIQNGKLITVRTTGCSSVKPRFVIYGGVLYGVAVNNNDTATRCTFSLPKTAGRVVQRLWERGSVKLKAGSFSDKFSPLGVHLYRVMPTPKRR